MVLRWDPHSSEKWKICESEKQQKFALQIAVKPAYAIDLMYTEQWIYGPTALKVKLGYIIVRSKA